MVGWCSMGTFNDPWTTTAEMHQTRNAACFSALSKCRHCPGLVCYHNSMGKAGFVGNQLISSGICSSAKLADADLLYSNSNIREVGNLEMIGKPSFVFIYIHLYHLKNKLFYFFGGPPKNIESSSCWISLDQADYGQLGHSEVVSMNVPGSLAERWHWLI